MNKKGKDWNLFNEDWTFWKSPVGTTLKEAQDSREKFAPVELPHDWLIYDTKNLYEDGFGWYRKVINHRANDGQRKQLYFEGVYMNSTLYVNGEKAGDWKYGYSSFVMDITDLLKEGENELLMLVRHQSPNSRWYSGAGIYRDVWLKECAEQYLPINGTYVHIEKESDDSFRVEIETEVAGNVNENTICEYELWYQGGIVRKLGQICLGDREKTEAIVKRLACGEEMVRKVSLTTTVTNPKLWSIEEPNCYTLKVVLKCNEQLEFCDLQEITIGFRTMVFDPNEGFFLNDKHIKIQGVCEHHDLGCLGAAFNKEALRRKFTVLRQMGVNGLRTSHNMPAEAFMDLADEMGFVVMTEAFDMWERPKTRFDYARFFIEWAERDVESWVRSDRNHPCLLFWSIGNEIYDTHADAHGEEITKRLLGYVKQSDPKGNAPVTIASNYMPWEGARNCADIVKYAGYNYGEKCYHEQHKEHPDWIIYGSETASVVASRGIYHFPLAQSILSDEDEQCSALGNSSTSWGADCIEQCLMYEEKAPFSLGQFLWTGFDYIGEPTPYHTKNSYFGQIDTAGFPKDSFYVLKAQWTDVNTAPFVHLFPYWDHNPGQLIDLRATSNGESIELFVNGTSMGRQELIHKDAEKMLADWQVPYVPGSVVAVAYDAQGREIAREEHHSFKDSRKIVISANKQVLRADNKDVCFITIETVDEDGYPVENAADYVTVTVEGPARLLGMDNGDSTDTDSYKCNCRKLFAGKLLAVVGTTHEAGKIKVTVSGDGLVSDSLELDAVAAGAGALSFLDGCKQTKADHVPVRKVELVNQGTNRLSGDCPQTVVVAKVYPENAEAELIFKVVNDSGIDVNFAKIEAVPDQPGTSNMQAVKIKALGDGSFRIRCMAKEPDGRITIISQLECEASGMGIVYVNPYEPVIAGLYSDSQGEMGNGNEKGVSTSRDTDSAFWFDMVDFGEFGSDTLTMPIFALDDAEYFIDVWNGVPYAPDSHLVDTVRYQKPSIWNTYQEETWTLKERFSGICTVGFVTHRQKLHFKSFSFKYEEKAYARLWAGRCERVYGDTFTQNGNYVEGIGNNVTLEFGSMNFGPDGSKRVVICGRTPLEKNTIHLRYTNMDGENTNRILEFTNASEYTEQSFTIEKLSGEGKLDIIFLPGSHFDFAYVQFC